MNKIIYDIAVVGAGASGLLAAHAALMADPKAALILLEKNDKVAKKIYATGNGRCNLLNINAKPSDYFFGETAGERDGNVGGLKAECGSASRDACAEFAEEVFKGCGPENLLKVLKGLGISPVEEEAGRMYPRSSQAASVASALERGAGKGDEKAEICTGFDVKLAEKAGDIFILSAADGRRIEAKKLIIAGGGKAGIQFGTDGRCLKIAESFGHRIIKPIPALTALMCSQAAPLAGVRVKGEARLLASFEGGQEEVLGVSEGEIQFNRDCVSGICVMDLSGRLRKGREEYFILELDFFPEYTECAFEEMLEKRRCCLGGYGLKDLLPAKLAEYLEERSGTRSNLRPDATGPNSSGENRLRLDPHKIKVLRLNIEGSKGWPDAQVTSGGVSLREIDPKTMESKIVPGLYFAGEVMDADGPCGGYNLTWAFATGYTAGKSAALQL